MKRVGTGLRILLALTDVCRPLEERHDQVDTKHFQRLQNCFDEVVELPQQERAAWLDRHVADDPELRKELEEMLVEHDREGVPVATAVGLGAMGGLAGATGGGGTGEVLSIPVLKGAYRLIRTLGEGGMGIVYEAEQAFPRRRVAIKSIRPDLATRSMLRRFRNEADLLARLHHPGIAQIYEAGFADENTADQAFFVMELVQGEPIHQYAHKHGLSVAQRLTLIVKICQAVEHAHQRRVMHRDLKPGNILVTAQGEPKILDFGVSRATESGSEGGGVGLTIDGQVIGTPAYMSPEQISGDASVDTRTDVYAIGVIAFQLLSGKLPFDVDHVPIVEAARRIREESPRSITLVGAEYGGDVQVVIAKAMHKDRDRRYASAGVLADEIERVLSGRAINARRDSALYVLGKLAGRHRTTVALMALLLAAIVSFGVVSSLMASRQTQLAMESKAARDRADAEAAKLRDALYVSLIGHAQAALSSDDSARAQRLLGECRADFRGWEWRYLSRLSDQTVRTIELAHPTRLGDLSPDGRMFVVMPEMQPIECVDMESGATIRTIASTRQAWDSAVSVDGTMIAVLEARGWVDVYESSTGDKKAKFQIPGEGAATYRKVAWLGASSRLILPTSTGEVHVADARTGESRVLARFNETVYECESSRDGAIVVAATASRRVVVLDSATGTQLASAATSEAANALSVSSRNNIVGLGLFNGSVLLWDWAGDGVLRPLGEHRSRVRSVAFSHDGSMLASGGEDRVLRTWSVKDRAPLSEQSGEPVRFYGVRFMPGDDQIVTWGDSKTVRVWSSRPEPLLPVIQTQARIVFDLCMTRDGLGVLVTAREGTVREVTLRGGKVALLGVPSARHAFASALGEVVTSTDGGTISFCDAATSKVVGKIELEGSAATHLVASEGGEFAVTWLKGNQLGTIDVARRQMGASWSTERAIKGACVSRQGMVGLTMDDGSVRVFDWEGKPAGERLGAGARITAMAFSRDGSVMGLADESGQTYVWDWSRGVVTARVVGSGKGVSTLAFLDGGRRLAGGGDDQLVHVWSLPSGEELLTFAGHRMHVARLCTTPDGQTLLSIDGTGELRVWSATGDR